MGALLLFKGNGGCRSIACITYLLHGDGVGTTQPLLYVACLFGGSPL